MQEVRYKISISSWRFFSTLNGSRNASKRQEYRKSLFALTPECRECFIISDKETIIMKHTLLFGGLGLVLLLAYADTGYGQKKKPAKDEANKATPDEYKQLQKTKEVEGKLASADAAAGRLYIELNAKEF